MEDLQDKIIELMDLFDDEVVTTADKIDRPQQALDREAYKDFMDRNPMAGGGSIGGGNIEGTPIGNRTGFENVFLKQGKKSRFGPGTDTIVIKGKEYRKISDKNNPNFGKYSFRESVSTGERYPSGRIKSKEKTTYYTEKQLRDRIAKGSFTGKALYKSYTPGYLAELKDIKKFVDDTGAKNIFLSDLVKMFGDETKETETEAVRDATTEKKIKRAIGEDEYKKLIKGGDRTKTTIQKKKDFNALVRAVKKGEKPLIALSSNMTGEAPNVFKSYLGKVEKGMYNSMIPKLRAIVSRVTQPRQVYEGTNAIEELKNTTTKTYNKIIKKYPASSAARNIITSGKGIVSYNDRSYVLSQLFRHVQNGGTKYSYVSGDTTATVKFRNNETGKLITLNNIDVNDPEFKEAADAYNEKEKIMNTEIDDPRKKGAKIKIGQAIAANGDSLVIDHLDDVKNNPLKNLAITNQKANMAATIKGATEAELESIGRGLKLSLEDNIKRYSNYAKRLLISPDKKRPSPKETIFTKTGTLRGVEDPPDLEIKKIISSLSSKPICQVTFGGIKSPALKADGGRIGYANGPASIDDCFDDGLKNFKDGKFKTADQAQDAAKLLGGGQKVLRGLMKYGIVPEAAYVAGEAVFRNILGEKPLNALKKSIDSFTFGATDFTSGIEAAKFGKDADRKLAVDKFRASQNKVNSIEQQLANLETLNTGSQFGYEGDQTEAIQMKKAQLEAAKKELEQNYVNPDIVQYIDRKGENIADAQMAKSGFAKASLKDQMDGIPGVADYMATETARVFPKQPSQTELNLKLLPNFREALKTDQAKIDRTIMNAPDDVLKDISPEALELKKGLQEAYKMENLKDTFGAEQIYGTQGSFFGEPLAEGGRAGFKLGSVRKGILKLIDDSVKSTPKDTTSALDKLIKKTLDEDLFDKKDRIVDSINISEAKKRKNYPYNMRVFEEPKNLDFYRAIKESNFRTKTGPFFDRIKKAGGGLLKQAGDRSGPPPELGPNSQGLQGLLNRGKKI